MKIYFERLGPKLPRYYMQIMLIVILLFSMTISAAAAEDMWEAADRIIKDVYTKIAGISTVLAGLMSAVAVVGAKVSNNQHKTDQAWDWLKRIWLCWIVINGIGAFLAYVQPLFDGLATLDPRAVRRLHLGGYAHRDRRRRPLHRQRAPVLLQRRLLPGREPDGDAQIRGGGQRPNLPLAEGLFLHPRPGGAAQFVLHLHEAPRQPAVSILLI